MPSPHYEKGKYRATITGQRFGEIPTDKRTPYFAIEIEPTEALGANDLPEPIYRREVILYFSDKAAPYSIDNLRRIGWQGSKLTELNPENDGFEDLSGIEVDVECDYNQRGYEDWALSGGGSQDRENDGEVASKLDRLFGKELKSSQPAKPSQKSSTKAKAKPKAAADEEDDEVPF